MNVDAKDAVLKMPKLTDRQTEVLRLIYLSNAGIGDILKIAPTSVAVHAGILLETFGAINRRELIIRAVACGFQFDTTYLGDRDGEEEPRGKAKRTNRHAIDTGAEGED